MASTDRLAVLGRHLAPDTTPPSLSAAPTAARALPLVDASVVERVLDPDPSKRAVRDRVHTLFAGRPDLLVPHVEGLRKGECGEEGGRRTHPCQQCKKRAASRCAGSFLRCPRASPTDPCAPSAAGAGVGRCRSPAEGGRGRKTGGSRAGERGERVAQPPAMPVLFTRAFSGRHPHTQHTHTNTPSEEHRDLVRSILRAVVVDGGFRPLTLYDTDLSTYFYLGELLALIDLSATIKTGVQYSLWGASLLNLGSATHKARWAADVDALKLPGCFAMTELGHGSNVAGLQVREDGRACGGVVWERERRERERFFLYLTPHLFPPPPHTHSDRSCLRPRHR